MTSFLPIKSPDWLHILKAQNYHYCLCTRTSFDKLSRPTWLCIRMFGYALEYQLTIWMWLCIGRAICRNFNINKMSQLMRLCYLSQRQPAKAQAILRIHAVSPEPSLFAHMKNGSRRRVQPKFRHLAPLDGCAVHAVWRTSLQRMESIVISRDGSNLR